MNKNIKQEKDEETPNLNVFEKIFRDVGFQSINFPLKIIKLLRYKFSN